MESSNSLAAAIDVAETNLARLLERRERALDGAGLCPDPKVVAAAEAVLDKARERLRAVPA